MRSKKTCALIAVSLLATSACVQTPSQVEMKGHYVYGKNGPKPSTQQQYAYAPVRELAKSAPPVSRRSSYAPRQSYKEPAQSTAGIQSVAVNELPPPKKSNVWASKANEVKAQKPVISASKWQPTGESYAKKKTKQLSKKAPSKKVKLITQPRDNGFIWPVTGKKIISSYGPKGSGKANDGMNIAAAQGEPVWAVSDGEVVFVGDQLSGYGNMVLIKHAGSYTTTYAHLNQATVDKYDRVKQGDIIGYVGSTGNVKRPQLYFAVRDGTEHVNPQTFLSRNVAGL